VKFFRTYTPELSHVRFHESTWELHEQAVDDRAWFTEKRDAARLRLFRHSPTNWSFDLRDADAARAFFENQANSFQGAMLELEVASIQGLEALVGVFKYRSPQAGHLGKYYVGVTWLPFQHFLFQINFEALERGTTGLREATVAAITKWEPVVEAEPEIVTSAEDLFEKLRSGTIRRLPSDDRQFDEMFPEHPLTKVRDLQQRFARNVVFHRRLIQQPPYRLNNRRPPLT
jgi:hypothetical protein